MVIVRVTLVKIQRAQDADGFRRAPAEMRRKRTKVRHAHARCIRQEPHAVEDAEKVGVH